MDIDIRFPKQDPLIEQQEQDEETRSPSWFLIPCILFSLGLWAGIVYGVVELLRSFNPA